MTEISKSPDRHSFQKEKYLERKAADGEVPSAEYLDLFDRILEQEKHKFDDSKSRENNLEYDLLTTDWILTKVRSSETYAQNLYAAMCNTNWRSKELWPTLKEQNWGCSWRYAGGIIADMRQQGDYIDWYCSGIRGGIDFDGDNAVYDDKKFVSEGFVTKEIEHDLDRLGWVLIEYEDKEE
jgi:hypothetical protein